MKKLNKKTKQKLNKFQNFYDNHELTPANEVIDLIANINEYMNILIPKTNKNKYTCITSYDFKQDDGIIIIKNIISNNVVIKYTILQDLLDDLKNYTENQLANTIIAFYKKICHETGIILISQCNILALENSLKQKYNLVTDNQDESKQIIKRNNCKVVNKCNLKQCPLYYYNNNWIDSTDWIYYDKFIANNIN